MAKTHDNPETPTDASKPLESDTPATGQGTPDTTPRSLMARAGFGWFVAVAAVLLTLVGFVGYQMGTATQTPSEGSADVGFARDMQTHHNQAVRMAMIVRDKSTDPTIRTIAYDIITSQQQQAGQLYGWLVQWGLPQTSSETGMAWMTAGEHQPEDSPAGAPATTAPSTPSTLSTSGPLTTSGPASASTSPGGDAAGHGMVMGSPVSTATPTGTQTADGTPSTDPQSGMSSMGMASPAQIRALEQASGVGAERLFLQLMISHHQGGVNMAQAALRLAKQPEVRTLAQAIDTAQQAEIRQLQQLLAERR